jgi:hypothetical protein
MEDTIGPGNKMSLPISQLALDKINYLSTLGSVKVRQSEVTRRQAGKQEAASSFRA